LPQNRCVLHGFVRDVHACACLFHHVWTAEHANSVFAATICRAACRPGTLVALMWLQAPGPLGEEIFSEMAVDSVLNALWCAPAPPRCIASQQACAPTSLRDCFEGASSTSVVLSRLWRTCAGLLCDAAPEPARAMHVAVKCVRPHRRPGPAARTVRGSLQLWQLASAVAAPPRSAGLVFQLARQLPEAPCTVALPVPDSVFLGALGRAARPAPGAPARTPGAPSLHPPRWRAARPCGGRAAASPARRRAWRQAGALARLRTQQGAALGAQRAACLLAIAAGSRARRLAREPPPGPVPEEESPCAGRSCAAGMQWGAEQA